ncbi:MAG: UvrD-helicase domain-containing protein [Alphaproteobacteria bacterium]|nr:UvrD-helicase domain-containing protein [Alphaproteobacteria bacterium]
MIDDIFKLEDEAKTFDNTSKLTPAFEWLEMLNPEQKQAVTTTEGPVLVLSGAGTGKTKVLTTRLAYILANLKAQPWNCLVVTFTNRAAKEMKQRTIDMIGDVANSVWLGTFHSIGVKILRTHAELVGLKSNFTILDEDDQKRLIKQILEAENIDDKKYPPQSLLDVIQRWKDKGITIDKIGNQFKDTTTTHVYKLYQKRLIELNCVDFGDILLHTLNILLENAEILKSYQEKFKYIMVDEYQDTNVTQYLMLRLLSQRHRNICCVGDDDQSIYSWRGAEIENILRFEKDFSDARIIRLERNYRSTANILAAASNLISHNHGRLGKTLKVAENSPASKVENTKIKVVSNYNGEDEANYVVSEIDNCLRQGYEYEQIAVLVRTAFQTREFEEKFIKEAIPYIVIGGPKFYERAEIRDALAYLRVVAQPDDDLALMRIINKPTRGIGNKTLDKIVQEARFSQKSMFSTINYMLETDGFTGKLKNAISEIMQNFAEWQKLLNILTPADLTNQILEDSGYIEMLKMDKSAESPGRLENLRELVNVISDEEQYPNLATFLEHVSLVIDKDDATDNNKVMLITLHSAKGLEFDVVFLPGWEEGLFPHQRSLDEGGAESLEEERRLAYVAITRARQKLYITTALNRRVYGQWQNNIPSRFINELPPQNIELSNNASRYFAQNNYGNNNYGNNSWQKKKTFQKSNITYDDDKRYSYVRDEEYAPKPHSEIGTKVFHETFGYGKITGVEGNKLHIYFDNFGHKKLMADYVTKV